jgi:hypothetical protein
VRGGEFDVRHLVPTGDAARVAIAYGSGLVLVLDAATLEPRLSLKPGGAVSRMSWSADGRWLAIAAESGGLVVAVDSGEVLARRCAGDFESRPLPPPRSTLSQAGVCE